MDEWLEGSKGYDEYERDDHIVAMVKPPQSILAQHVLAEDQEVVDKSVDMTLWRWEKVAEWVFEVTGCDERNLCDDLRINGDVMYALLRFNQGGHRLFSNEQYLKMREAAELLEEAVERMPEKARKAANSRKWISPRDFEQWFEIIEEYHEFELIDEENPAPNSALAHLDAALRELKHEDQARNNAVDVSNAQ